MFPRPPDKRGPSRLPAYLILCVFLLGVAIGGLGAWSYQSRHATQTPKHLESLPAKAPAPTADKASMDAILAKAAAFSTATAAAAAGMAAGHEQEQDEIFKLSSQIIKSKGGGQPGDILDFFIGNQAKCQPDADCGTYDNRTGRVGQPVTWTFAKSADFNTEHYRNISAKLGMKQWMHRKYWEWYFIYDTLANKFPGLVAPGKKGVGFGVGLEPLPSAFAALGASVMGTDMAPTDEQAKGWADTNQHATDGKKSMFYPSLVKKEDFDRLASFEFANMNQLPSKWHGQFDFVWSSCSMEHVGSLEQSTRFFIESTKLLKPGGVTIHTTEFLLNGLENTIERNSVTVIWRYKDVVRVRDELIKQGFKVFPIDVQVPDTLWDRHVDRPPYPNGPESNPVHHLKMFIGSHASTSIAIIAQKPA